MNSADKTLLDQALSKRFAADVTLNEALRNWILLVLWVEQGKPLNFGVFYQFLNFRGDLDQLVRQSRMSVRRPLEAMLVPWDDRWRRATRPLKDPLWVRGACDAKGRRRPRRHVPWWAFRVPHFETPFMYSLDPRRPPFESPRVSLVTDDEDERWELVWDPPPETDEDRAPRWSQDWLRNSLIGNNFPWRRATRTTLATFLADYTFHDSTLLGIWMLGRHGALLVLRWDLADNAAIGRRYEKEMSDDPVADFDAPSMPVLLVWFREIYQMTRFEPNREYPSFIFDVVSGPLAPEVRDSILGLTFRRIQDATGGAWRLNPGPASDIGAVSSRPEIHETVIKTSPYEGLSLIHDVDVSILVMSPSGAVVKPRPRRR